MRYWKGWMGMRILIACEESQRVCIEFRRKGHEAYSCDILDCSGGHPEWHIKDDVIKHLDDGWDMIIAFPPCTHLCVSGARHFEKKRKDGRQREGIEFFCKFLEADCERICIENPIGIMSGDYIAEWFPDLAEKHNLPVKPTQIIQPYFFGDHARKSTCLWLKNLPALVPTQIVEPELITYKYSDGKITTFSKDIVTGITNKNRSTKRSKTYPGVAKAMAEQWG